MSIMRRTRRCTLRKELARFRLHRIGGLSIAVPQGLRLRPRRFGSLLPALLDVVQLADGLLEILRLLEIVFRAKGLGVRDQLLLHRGIRESLPLVHLAELVELGRQCTERRLQPFEEGVALGVRQDRRVLQRGA